jgi:hypothetical protein
MKMHHVKLGISLLVGLVIGTLVGVLYVKRTIGMSFGQMSQWAAVGTYAQLTDLQYQYANELRARASLSDFLGYTENLKATSYLIDRKALEVSVARTYVRLAVLDRQSGNADDYESDLSRAQSALTAAGSPHNTLSDVQQSVNQLASRRSP